MRPYSPCRVGTVAGAPQNSHTFSPRSHRKVINLKRLVFCFDGTWNQLSSPNPTNVVIVAQSVVPDSKTGTQIIHYDSGVGTGADDRWTGGLFGEGLIDKLVDAYTFLVFNYKPGDELFIFGFSRGAFTARAFVGFLRNLGIVQRKHAVRIADAARLYKARMVASGHDAEELLRFRWEYSPEICVDPEEDAWRVRSCSNYSSGQGLVLRIKYLGVWDTVGALGLPNNLVFSKWVNQGEQYFDTALSSMVVSGRHAVSIDEQRTTFTPTLWPNWRELNASLGYSSAASDVPYQQKWFPGDHGSVGGGGDVRGLSDGTLSWVLDGARRMGLVVDTDRESPLYGLSPNPLASLRNMGDEATVSSIIEGAVLTKAPRSGGPTTLEEVSDSALARWRSPKEQLPEQVPYRPTTLDGAAAAIEAGGPAPRPQAAHPAPAGVALTKPTAGALYKVVYGDTLGALASELYGAANLDTRIVAANRFIEDADRIFVGQLIYLPTMQEAAGK